MDLDETLQILAEDPAVSVDLAEVALLVARDEYSHLDVEGYLSELDGLAHEARSFLGGSFESRVAGLCRYLFHEAGFHGNQKRYYDPRNSYLNDVIDRQTGIPISLCLVAMAVGQRVDLPIGGVGLPGHFIAMAQGEGDRVLFDPFHGGKRLDPSDCESLVREAAGVDLEITAEMLQPSPPGAIVTRILTNLKGCYLRTGDFARAARTIRRLVQIMPSDWTQHRDLGVCLFQAHQAGRAIDHLTTYLEHVPNADDTETVEKLLHDARAEVAQWN